MSMPTVASLGSAVLEPLTVKSEEPPPKAPKKPKRRRSSGGHSSLQQLDSCLGRAKKWCLDNPGKATCLAVSCFAGFGGALAAGLVCGLASYSSQQNSTYPPYTAISTSPTPATTTSPLQPIALRIESRSKQAVVLIEEANNWIESGTWNATENGEGIGSNILTGDGKLSFYSKGDWGESNNIFVKDGITSVTVSKIHCSTINKNQNRHGVKLEELPKTTKIKITLPNCDIAQSWQNGTVKVIT